MLAVIFAGHGILGLLVGGGRILSVIAADPLIDLILIACGVALFVVARPAVSGGVVRAVLIAITLLMLLLGWMASQDPTMGGLAPSRATYLDVFIYYVSAAACALTACAPRAGATIDA